ncbi:Nitrogen regulation protein NR(II) [Blastochloris viridis]|uniref:histidine kinase n=1 Tax=Blastochloris viridis TaxID=1079 RepID=A0A0S4Q1L0_BLAVI|nr:PAS domain-containing sensor histidine kinase [Blastochloris viridis]CUU42352.1 Nitrogen regulation protein NR(II) [Blastochloris viridis]
MPRRLWVRLLGPLAVGLALLSALATFLVLAGLTPIAPTHEIVVTLLGTNAITVAGLLAVIVREGMSLWVARKRGRAGARLHIRVVSLFSVIAALPAILVAVVASITLDRGLDRWFSERTKLMVETSIGIGQAYVREHAGSIRGEILAMAQDFNRLHPIYDSDRERFRQIMTGQATLRGLPVAMLIKRDLTIIERANIQLAREILIPATLAIGDATEEQPLIQIIGQNDIVAAVMPLKAYEDTYLLVARPIDPRVIDYLQKTQASIDEFRVLEERRFGVQVAFALMYVVIALIVLLSAVWIGLAFANTLVAPIRRLIGAANLVAAGNLYVQVPVRRPEGDLANLGESFNKMTQELRSQRDDLIGARDLIDQRRRFTEAVLAGVSAGVFGLDAAGNITIVNRSAEGLLGLDAAEAVGKPVAEVVPELASLVEDARAGGNRLVQGQVTLVRKGRERTLLVRVTSETAADPNRGFIVTLDDITDLVTAQRTSAWADVARRIAHEIKNPLTPIQLSAERLKRKYGKVIQTDREVFEQCTDTIIRQVGDIGRMVDEFASFARMPKPTLGEHDAVDMVRQAVFLMKMASPDITFESHLPDTPVMARFDRRQLSQAVTNIVKNATEAVAAAPPDAVHPPKIEISLGRDGDDVVIDVIDNGIGLPAENRQRLLEPYVTTREKGTGLGLAIVGRILEDHGGGIELADAPAVASGGRGAWVRLRFQADPPTPAAQPAAAHDSRQR